MTDANVLYGRSSSHFTRVARIFAAELKVPYALEVVRDLGSLDPDHYGSNPALKIPVLRTTHGVWFGSLAVSQELARQSQQKLRIVWPNELTGNLLVNAQELVLSAMASEVSLILAKRAFSDASDSQSAYVAKMHQSLTGVLDWLEARIDQLLDHLPERDISFLEVTLFCLLTHLPFREVLDTSRYEALTGFAQRFSGRASAQATQFLFDV